MACKAFWGACFNLFCRPWYVLFFPKKISFKSVITLSTGFGPSSFCLMLTDIYVDISGRSDSTDHTAVGVEVEFWPRI